MDVLLPSTDIKLHGKFVHHFDNKRNTGGGGIYTVPGLLEHSLLQSMSEILRQKRVVLQKIADAAIRQEVDLVRVR